MRELSSTASLGTVWIPLETAWEMVKRGQMSGIELTNGQVKADLTVVVRHQPIYVSRNQYEQLTGRFSDGWERLPDAMVRKPLEARVNGQLVLRKDLDAILDAAGPAEAVAKARELLAKIDESMAAAPAVQVLHG